MQDDPKLAALRRGMLEPIVLASIERHRRYAAEIVDALQASDFPVLEGTLYPLLSKMRRDGLVEHEWQESATGPPRKYLALTAEGHAQLATFRAYWGTLTATLTNVGD